MPKTIYDKPARALLKDMVIDLDLKPGQVFTSGRAVEWFAQHYPKLKPITVRAHLVQAATNDAGRLHHPATNESDDVLFKIAPGQFRLYEPGKDPAPIHEAVAGDVERQEAQVAEIDAEEEEFGASEPMPARRNSCSRRISRATWPATSASSNRACSSTPTESWASMVSRWTRAADASTSSPLTRTAA